MNKIIGLDGTPAKTEIAEEVKVPTLEEMIEQGKEYTKYAEANPPFIVTKFQKKIADLLNASEGFSDRAKELAEALDGVSPNSKEAQNIHGQLSAFGQVSENFAKLTVAISEAYKYYVQAELDREALLKG